jgi:hypothetical protein
MDMEYGKLSKLVKDETQNKDMRSKLWEHYELIYNIFLFELGSSGSTTIGWNEFTSYAKKVHLTDYFDLSTMDKAFIATNFNTHGATNPKDRNL